MLLKEFIKDHTNSSHNNGTYNDSKSWQIAWSFEEHYCNTPWTRTKQMCCLRTLQAGPWNTGVTSYSYTSVRENRKEKKKSHSICSPWIYWQYYSTLWARTGLFQLHFPEHKGSWKSKNIPNKNPPMNIPQVQSPLQTFLLTNFQSEILTSLQLLCSGQCFVFLRKQKQDASLRQCKNISMVLSMVL